MSMADMNSPIQVGGSADLVEPMIAPVQKTLTAIQAYAIGDLFIFNNELYKATKAIINGTTISIGTGANDNANYASTLAEEMRKSSGVKSVTYKGANGVQSISSGSSLVINCTTKVGTEDLTDYEVVGLGGYLIGSINGLMVKMVNIANKQLGVVNYTNTAISNYDTSNVSMTIYYKHI